MDPPMEEVLGRSRVRAGGFCRGAIPESAGISWVAMYRCCDGSLKETQTPQPRETEIWDERKMLCSGVHEENHEWEGLSC